MLMLLFKFGIDNEINDERDGSCQTRIEEETDTGGIFIFNQQNQ